MNYKKSFWLLLSIFVSGTLQSTEKQPKQEEKISAIRKQMSLFIKKNEQRRLKEKTIMKSNPEDNDSNLQKANNNNQKE